MNQKFEAIRNGPVHVQIGKNGITDGMIEHMENLLKEHRTIKIKLLKSVADYVPISDVIGEIMKKIPIHVVDQRGNIAILSIYDKMTDVNYPRKYVKMRSNIAVELGASSEKKTR